MNSIDEYQKPVNIWRKGDLYSKLKNTYPSDEEIQRNKQTTKLFNTENGGKYQNYILIKVLIFYLQVFLRKSENFRLMNLISTLYILHLFLVILGSAA